MSIVHGLTRTNTKKKERAYRIRRANEMLMKENKGIK